MSGSTRVVLNDPTFRAAIPVTAAQLDAVPAAVARAEGAAGRAEAAGTEAVQQALQGATELGSVALLLDGSNADALQGTAIEDVQIETAPTQPKQIARVAEVSNATTLADADVNAGDARPLKDIAGDTLLLRNFWRAGDADWSNAFQRAIDYAASQGGGTIRVTRPRQAGTSYMTSRTIIMRTGVILDVDQRATIRLANGSNCTMIEGQDFRSLTGTNSGLGISDWGIIGYGTLDGNRANNTGAPAGQGHGVAIFGRDFVVDIRIKNCYRRGLHLEYGNTQVGVSPFNGCIKRVVTDTTGEEGIWLGVSDAHVWSANVRYPAMNGPNNTFDGIYLKFGVRASHINVWGGNVAIPSWPRYALNVEGEGMTASNIHLESGFSANLRLAGGGAQINNIQTYNHRGNTNLLIESSGNILGARAVTGQFGSRAAVALRMGTATAGAYLNIVDLYSSNHDLGAVDLTYSSGGNAITLNGFNDSASSVSVVGWTSSSDTVRGRVSGGAFEVLEGGRGSRSVQFGHNAAASSTSGVAVGPGAISSGTGGIALGNGVVASGQNSLVLGTNSTASGFASSARGVRAAAEVSGEHAEASFQRKATGDCQRSHYYMAAYTTNATPTLLSCSGFASLARLTIPIGGLLDFRIDLTGIGETDTSKFFRATYSGLLRRISGVGTTMLAGPAPVLDAGNAAGWSVAVTADTTNGALQVQATGDATIPVVWLARVTATKILL
ncbi:hypothetical protein [Pseudoroseomonas ludipueritiae]|uniref:Uncharacterized protein n=1 Tax=Pseudoroseomonas ludipueritiae TaxID=198093 RepID=A0ABR7R4Q7_9PROT|nr:hypothetical protein [Pseudoroseomonas ludipueritiae]MBC9176754.1 hypothetical protein [Pseudoroseomonas ludipueritiae]